MWLISEKPSSSKSFSKCVGKPTQKKSRVSEGLTLFLIGDYMTVECMHHSCEHNRKNICMAEKIKIYGRCRDYQRLDGEELSKAPFKSNCINHKSVNVQCIK